MDWDTVLGGQQDQLARSRYDLAKLIDSSPHFQGCKAPVDVFARILELRGEEFVKQQLVEQARNNPTLTLRTEWIAATLDAIRSKDQDRLEHLWFSAVDAKPVQLASRYI